MIWWLADEERVRAEKSAFVALQEEHDWLTSVRVRFLDNLQLCIDVDLEHGSEIFVLAVIYPTTFPDTPPIVMPYGERRLSEHQYGAGGELCLQWRPDNWDAAVTGAMMVESAYGLISTERPPDGRTGAVPSDHLSSLAAELRFETWRLMVPEGAWDSLDGHLPEMVVEVSLAMTARNLNRVAHLTAIGGHGSELWRSAQPFPKAVSRTGYLLRTEQDFSVLAEHGGGEFADIAERVPELAPVLGKQELPFLIVMEKSGRRTAYDVQWSRNGLPFLIPYRIIEEGELAKRSASNRDALSKAHVAIVGCGSIGSKIAVSLARSGVSKFLLVDEDVFLTGNLVRNDLDARAIGWHKVDALSDRITQIVGNADVVTRKVALGGQTSAVTMDSILEMMGEYDLIIDATANPTSFNLCAGVSKRNRKPMLWAEIFGGGIGGIVARTRPETEPPPLEARNQITTWCEDHEKPWETRPRGRYEAGPDEGQPFVADDADVAVIAAHATRFAIDILEGGQRFPFSAYAIGLTKAWIFDAPFDTWPIDLRPSGPWDTSSGTASSEVLVDLMAELTGESAS
ncbi:putative ThiF/HesA family dinucleotide-utilizing enzyme [Rhizobium ruizarguesonis]